jgi:hypothetical protein
MVRREEKMLLLYPIFIAMRILLLLTILFSSLAVKSQTIEALYGSAYSQKENLLNSISLQDTLSSKKWLLSKYTGISTGISFYNGGRATFLAAPMGLQLNRRLNNNLYAYANLSVVPAMTRFHSNKLYTGMNKSFNTNSFPSNSFQVNPAASVGLMYVNDSKTFSISGGFSVERNNYLFVPYYPAIFPKNSVNPSGKIGSPY